MIYLAGTFAAVWAGLCFYHLHLIRRLDRVERSSRALMELFEERDR